MTIAIPRSSGIRALHATIALAAVLVACSGDDDADDAEASTTTAAPDTTVPPTTIAVTTTPPLDGVTFTPPEGDYTIVFPAEPTANEQNVALPDGTSLPMTFYIVEQGATAFGSAVVVYAAGTEVSLEGSRDGAVANISGTLVDSQPITLQGRDGLQFSADVEGAGTYLARIYVDDVRLYQFIHIGEGEPSFDDPDIAAFFDSLRFTEDR